MAKAKTDPLTYFNERVDRTPDGCWIWTGALTVSGYGMSNVGPKEPAHRLAARLFLGLTTRGWEIQVLHRCDVKRCVNPEHLYLGSHWDNMRDRDERHLQPVGAAHGHAKIRAEDVNVIREAYVAGEAQEVLATRYGVAQGTISALLAGKTWRHIRPTVVVELRRVGAPVKHGRYVGERRLRRLSASGP